MWIPIAFIAGLLWGALIMYWYYNRNDKPEQTELQETIQKFFNRIVNVEELEEHEKLVKLRMERNRRKTTRVDSGPNARVMRMRLTRRPRG
jgi:hypothetical protein